MTENKSVMMEAEGLVNGERAAAYGHPKENFQRICGLWNEYLFGKYGEEGSPINELDHAIMMMLVKIARLQETPDHRDSLVDICGYAGTYEKVLQRDLEDEAKLEAAYFSPTETPLARTYEKLYAQGLITGELVEIDKHALNPMPGDVWKVTEESLTDTHKGDRRWRSALLLTFFKGKDGTLWYRRSGQNDNDHLEARWEPVMNKSDWEFSHASAS